MTQIELAERWQISEATLERWRTEAGGPLFLKLGNQVRYRVQDVEAFEAEMLRASTKPHGEVIQTQPEAPALPAGLRQHFNISSAMAHHRANQNNGCVTADSNFEKRNISQISATRPHSTWLSSVSTHEWSSLQLMEQPNGHISI